MTGARCLPASWVISHTAASGQHDAAVVARAQVCYRANMNIWRTIGRWFGYDMFRLERQARIETHLAALLPKLGVNVVVDAGANTGQYARSLRRLGYHGRIVSYEPLDSVHGQLARAAQADAQWTTRRLALGASGGNATIRMSPDTSWSSMRGFSAFGSRRFAEQDCNAVEEAIEVVRLDADLPELIADITEPRIYLKMDTQGFDLEVFKGASGLLDRIVALQAEVAFQQIYEGAPGYREALATFEEAGFAVTGMFPVKRDRKSLRMIEMDCVMRRVETD